jgi:hypothetical protein
MADELPPELLGLGPAGAIIGGLIRLVGTGGSTPATEQTQREFELEQSRSEATAEGLWDFPFGGATAAPPSAPTTTLPPSLGTPTSAPSLPAPTLPPPGAPPGPPAQPPPASGGWSTETYRRSVERVMRDTATRRGAPAPRPPIEGEILRAAPSIFGRVLGSLGGILWPSPIDPGVPTPDEQAEARRRFEESIGEESIGERVTRAIGVGAGGIGFGTAVIFEQLEQLGRVTPVGFPMDEPVPLAPIPAVEIPTPGFQQPRLPSPATPAAPPIPLPQPPPLSTPTRGSQTVPRSRQRGATSSSSPFSFAWPSFLGLLENRRSVLPQGTTSALTPGLSTPPFSSLGDAPSRLTQLNTQPVPSIPPPTLRTRTRTRECECEPKKKRKKPRKCRARAPLRWAGGPKKGKPAGFRCYSFEGTTR